MFIFLRKKENQKYNYNLYYIYKILEYPRYNYSISPFTACLLGLYFASFLCHRCSHFSCFLRNERISHIALKSFCRVLSWSKSMDQRGGHGILNKLSVFNVILMTILSAFALSLIPAQCPPPPSPLPPPLFSGWCIWPKEDLSVGTCFNWSYWLQWQWRYKFSLHRVCSYSSNIEISLWILCSINKEQKRGKFKLLQCLFCLPHSYLSIYSI